MTSDYGQDLAFGIFPSPDAVDAGRTLELSQVADVSGLDLVTVQDHPYQARHLDAWTLLSVIAARTSTIRVALNVANLPLRPPVVLARSIATLDLLSGGRVELGLGAGAFWDAIVAAGGARLAPGEAVDALGEGIDVIRSVWAGEGAPSVRVEGRHHRVVGLHPGPAPAHDVEIWLGAYKPRMLRLTATKADGWLPSMGYADPQALPDLNAAIDEAALKAGRSPADVRRLYNINGRFGRGGGFLAGSPMDWAEQLAELTLTTGMSTYILGTNDADDVRRFAAEVAPATRELVDAERSRRSTAPPADTGPGAPRAIVEAAERPGPSSLERSVGGERGITVVPTPDEGTRLTGELEWDEASRPTAPPVGPGPAYTAQQQAVPQHLLDIHDGLRSELERLRDVIEQVAQGHLEIARARNIVNTMTMRQNNWTLGAFCESYCRIVTSHHSLEDHSIFRHLRRADPAITPVLDRLEEEHELIADVLDQVDRALVALVAEEDGAMEGIQHAVDLLTDTLLSHLAYEERELLHPLAQHGFY